jgi:hypothetical protein
MALRQLAMIGIVAFCGGGLFDNLSSTLKMKVSGEIVRIDGLINSRAARQFRRMLDRNPQVVRVQFGEIEGSSDDETVVELGYFIRDRGLATFMGADAEVYSGGVDLFLAGVVRTVASGAVIGVHEWQTGFGQSGRDYPRGASQHEPTRGFIEDMLGSDAFYWFTLDAAAFDEVYVMNRGEMIRFGLITH